MDVMYRIQGSRNPRKFFDPLDKMIMTMMMTIIILLLLLLLLTSIELSLDGSTDNIYINETIQKHSTNNTKRSE
jgi:cell division protein FtsX